ncbi:hypothetical protein D1007_52061 [Hordeum vulgare]|nr:hypothetical protein D1007_52061 [Hordeum vulgare]
MVYTNEPLFVEISIQTMEQLLAEDKYRVVSFDLEFTSGRARQDQKKALRVFTRFINSPDYSFATVDTTNGLKEPDVSGLTCQNLVNTRDHYKVWGSTNNKQNCPVDLASAIIDPYYMNMKDEIKKEKNALHSAQDQRLDEEHVKYAAKDVYISYKMYRRLADMRKCLRLAPHEGSSTKHSRERHKN